MKSTSQDVSPAEYTLIHEEGGTDYRLEEGRTAWITVGNISVHIKHGDEGASISLYAKGHEDGDSLTETWLEFREAQAVIDWWAEEAANPD